MCDYVILNDLLVNKESFVKAFDSIEKKRSLVGDLIKNVKDSNIVSDEVDNQKSAQKVHKNYYEVAVFLRKELEIFKVVFNRMSLEKQKNFMEELEQLRPEERIKGPFLAMKKPKALTVADLELAAMDQNFYTRLSYQCRNGKHVGHDTNDERAGHAVLIKKNSDNSFAFYDPNFGAVFDLTEEQLCEVVTQSFYKYIEMSKLCIVALFIFLTSVVAGIAAAVYGYNIIASLSLIICLVDLSISCYLTEKLVPQQYDTIVSADSVAAGCKECEIELKNLIDKYCVSDGKSGSTVESDVQVEEHNQGRDCC